MIYAPILITTLNRYECFKRCIESLQENSWSDKTELFISVDYPPTTKYHEGYNKIKAYLAQELNGFQKVHVYFQEKNLGAIKNAEWLRDLVCRSHNRYIFLEDDNELAPGFIEFCDKGLELFEDDESIIALNASDYVWCGNGFTPPVRAVGDNENNIEKRQLVFHAVAYWENKREKVSRFCNKVQKQHGLYNVKSLLKLHKKSRCFFYNFLAMVSLQNQELPWFGEELHPIDFMVDIYMILFDKYVLCPVGPLQRDFGVDGNGVNYKTAFKNAKELKQRPWLNDKGFEFEYKDPIIINDHEITLHDNNVALSYMTKIKILLKYVFKTIKTRNALN